MYESVFFPGKRAYVAQQFQAKQGDGEGASVLKALGVDVCEGKRLFFQE